MCQCNYGIVISLQFVRCVCARALCTNCDAAVTQFSISNPIWWMIGGAYAQSTIDDDVHCVLRSNTHLEPVFCASHEHASAHYIIFSSCSEVVEWQCVFVVVVVVDFQVRNLFIYFKWFIHGWNPITAQCHEIVIKMLLPLRECDTTVARCHSRFTQGEEPPVATTTTAAR